MKLFDGVTSLAELQRRIELSYRLSRQAQRPPPLHCVLVVGKPPITDLENVAAYDQNFCASLAPIEEGLYRIDYSRTWQGKTTQDSALALERSDGWIVLLEAGNIRPFVGILWRLQPRFWLAYLRSRDFLGLLEHHSKQPNALLDIYLVVMRRGTEADVRYNPRNLDQIKEHVQQDYFLKSVTFRLNETSESRSESRTVFDCKISRSGRIDFRAGYFSLFDKLVLQPVLRMARLRHDFYSERDRFTKEGKVQLSPVLIEFSRPLTATDLDSLQSALLDIRKLDVTIVHAGNPFFFAHVVDQVDGSLIDVAATGKSIFITPTVHASAPSLLRICQPVLIGSREGALRDYYEQRGEPSIADE